MFNIVISLCQLLRFEMIAFIGGSALYAEVLRLDALMEQLDSMSQHLGFLSISKGWRIKGCHGQIQALFL